MRATAPVVGVGLLVAITVACATAVVGAVAIGPGGAPPTAALTLEANASADRIAVTHTGGDAVPPDGLSVTISIDGEPLTHQPPVPFFAATGFRAGPLGPFNAATTGDWMAGQTGAVALAATNQPLLDEGDRVAVTVATDRAVIAELETLAE